MRRQLKTLAILAAVLSMAAILFAAPSTVGAIGQGGDGGFDDGIGEPGFDPADAACVEPHAPYYTHRLPVIIQDLRSNMPAVVAWGYAEACTARADRKGETSANMVERPRMILTNFEDFREAALGLLDLLDVADALPGTEHPGDNAFRFPLPALRDNTAKHLLNPEISEHCIGLFCPGIPEELGNYLGSEGFESVNATDGRRWLIDAGREKGILIAYFPAKYYDPFYVREPRFTPSEEYGYGGIIRVMLNPVDIALFGAEKDQPLAEETEVNDDGTAIITVHVYNGSKITRNVTLGWRVKGESEWRPVHGPSDKMALAPWSHHKREITVSGVEPGTVIEVMANYDRSQIEMHLGGIYDDAYANNIGRTTLVKKNADIDPGQVKKSADIDLGISLKAPSQYRIPLTGQACYNVTMTVTSDAPQPVTALVRLAVDGGIVYNKHVQIPAKGSRNISLCVDAGEWNRAERLEAVVDPDNAIPERNENNNRATASVQILPPPDQPGPAPESGVDVELSG